jgi:ribosome-associated translation inhibitor RaiA
MRIALLTRRDVDSENILDALERRAHRLLGRVSDRIADLAVGLADLNGPKGGVDRECQLQARLHDGRTLVVRARSTDFGKAIDGAMHKLLSRLLKLRKKAADLRRQAMPIGRLAASV